MPGQLNLLLLLLLLLAVENFAHTCNVWVHSRDTLTFG